VDHGGGWGFGALYIINAPSPPIYKLVKEKLWIGIDSPLVVIYSPVSIVYRRDDGFALGLFSFFGGGGVIIQIKVRTNVKCVWCFSISLQTDLRFWNDAVVVPANEQRQESFLKNDSKGRRRVPWVSDGDRKWRPATK